MANDAKTFDQVIDHPAPLPKLPTDQAQQTQGLPYDQSGVQAQRAATAAALARVISSHPDIAGSR
jgi:hypothetical protein